jgi:DNA-directed RNA polymerase subunit omega
MEDMNKKLSSMINPPITALMTKVDSRYTLVIAVSKRARQLAEGQPALVECSSHKPVSIACHEILEGKVSYIRPKDVAK